MQTIKLIKMFGSALFDDIASDDDDDDDDMVPSDAEQISPRSQVTELELMDMEDSVHKMEITPERHLHQEDGVVQAASERSPPPSKSYKDPNHAPVQGRDLPPSHTLRYLDACGIMINKMMTGGH